MLARSASAFHPVRSLAEALAADADVRWAYLFGSAVRDGTFADLDVAIMLATSARGVRPLGEVVARLEAVAEGIPVDVVDLAHAAPRLAGSVAREGRILVDRGPAARVAWEIEANRRALDIEPWLREFDRLREKSLRQREP
jgi:predicted nucleotidyltransferase